MKKLIFWIFAIASVSSCNLLDLSPIDYYGSSNYWNTEENVSSYMDGLHTNLRSVAFQHSYVFGEARGGTSKVGQGVDGVALSYQDLVTQSLSATSPGVSKFGSLYGNIANVNIFLENVKKADYLPEDSKSYYLAQAYGLRAFYYFDLYRVYGTCPLRLDPNEAVAGNYNPDELYMERSSASKVMSQIKSDLAESLSLFGDRGAFDYFGRGNQKAYWSKAATEYLAAEVYLWNSKVSVGDNKSDPNDIEIAEDHLQSLMNNYALSLESDYADVFSVDNKGNEEIIMAIRFAEGEATNSYHNFLYSYNNSNWVNVGFNDEDGDPMGDIFNLGSSSMQKIEFLSEFYMGYDDSDSRKDVNFLGAYSRTDNSLQGTVFTKIMGHYNSSTNVYVYDADMVLYRFAGVYLMMAEVQNMKGGDVAYYINKVRERAYGISWDEVEYGYENGTFRENELAILAEKDKEMLGEGQRWWDLLRMTIDKNGDHLVFCIEGSKTGGEPILDKGTEGYKTLWPIETEMLNKDPELKQTPGYEDVE